jgi:hypothetical protein
MAFPWDLEVQVLFTTNYILYLKYSSVAGRQRGGRERMSDNER